MYRCGVNTVTTPCFILAMLCVNVIHKILEECLGLVRHRNRI